MKVSAVPFRRAALLKNKKMEIALWVGLGLVALFVIRVIAWLVNDFRKNGH
jgi:hypothetical protein